METSCTEETTRRESLSPSPEGGGTEAESKKLPSSKYKGVVPQPNRRWGAQIYEKHQRVWLGTFNSEEEAARVYDIAARRFRGPEAITNFEKPHPRNDVESAFFNSHSKAEIVDMLRKHTYNDELHQSKPHLTHSKLLQPSTKRHEELFEKTVTPSDVGKLNRLVIPKQQAEKHFPLENNNNNNNNNDTKGVSLSFEEESGKVWRFRYSYWNSSQSYVLTKGWRRFVKDKGLKAGDVVTFLKSVSGDNKFYIDWKVGSHGVVVGGPVRLFGVDIFPGCNGNGKRKNEMAVLSLQCDSGKKQRVVVDVL